MTEGSRSYFVADILPYIQKLAIHRAAPIDNEQDREDAEAEFITEAWEHFVRLTDLEPEPSLGRVLTGLLKPKPVWTHRPEPDFRMLSMGSPRIRRMAEAVPA